MADEEYMPPRMEQLIRWREQYVSASLNRKFWGILTPGIYKGFVLSSCNIPEYVLVAHGSDYRSTALVERNGYCITVTMTGQGYVKIPAVGSWYICIDAYYTPNDKGYQRIVATQNVESHHVILGTVELTAAGAIITQENISIKDRDISTLPSMAHIYALLNKMRELSTHRSAVVDLTGVVSGDIITLPENLAYVPSFGALRMFYNGLHCVRGEQFEEVAVAEGESTTRKVKILFNIQNDAEVLFAVDNVIEGLGDIGSLESVETIVDRVLSLERDLDTLSQDVPYIETV